jgi:hypothetical protein
MGEKTGFSDATSHFSQYEKGKETALSTLNFLPVSSGFYFYTFSILSFVFTALIAGILYFVITFTAENSEKMFIKYGTDFLLSSKESINTAVRTSRYGNITRFVKDQYDSQPFENRFIQEIFYLDRKGKVLVHTDLTKLTQSSNTSINRLSSIYNNELFHTGLMLPEGEVNVQMYPYDTFKKDRSYIYFLKYILPVNYFEAMDFSFPVYLKKRPEGTFHIVLTRIYSDELIKSYLLGGLIAWGSLIFISLILSFFIKLPITLRLKKLRIFVQNYLVEDIDTYIEKTEKHKIKEEIEYIDAKISEIMNKTLDSHKKTAEKPVEARDAFLIREH